jgi:hypothetical protein
MTETESISFAFQKYTRTVKFKKFFLRFGKAANVRDAISNDAHFLQGFFVSHRRDKYFTAVFKGNKTSVKQMVNRRSK